MTETGATSLDLGTVVETTLEFGFPRLLEIDAILPVDFQRLVRGEYPLLTTSGSFHLYVPANAQDDPGDPVLKRVPAFEFSTVDGDWRVNLSAEQVRLTTDTSHGWSACVDRLDRLREALLSAYDVAHLTRIMVGRRNVLVRSRLGLDPDEPWSSLVRPSLLGTLDDALPHAAVLDGYGVETRMSVGSARLFVRHGVERDVAGSEPGFYIESNAYVVGTLKPGRTEVLKNVHDLSGEIDGLLHWALARGGDAGQGSLPRP